MILNERGKKDIRTKEIFVKYEHKVMNQTHLIRTKYVKSSCICKGTKFHFVKQNGCILRGGSLIKRGKCKMNG